jgi:hypothetical protein
LTDELREQIRQRREDRERLQAQIKREQANSCPLDRRNHGIRSLHRHWGLAPSHRADLRRRGVTPSQIEKLYFSQFNPKKYYLLELIITFQAWLSGGRSHSVRGLMGLTMRMLAQYGILMGRWWHGSLDS